MLDDPDIDAIMKKINGGKRKRGDNRRGNIEDDTALNFARKHDDDFRYVAIWNRWMRWDADHWQHEDTLEAFDEARVLCRDAGDAKAKTVAAVVTLARADRAIVATELVPSAVNGIASLKPENMPGP